jgi:hypothetical protein
MRPKWHILFGFVISYILVYFFNISIIAGTVIFLSSFLIDIDHYAYYVITKKEQSLRKAYNYFIEARKKFISFSQKEKKKYRRPLMVFHGIEFLAILIALSIFNNFFLWVLIGIAIHMILDFSEMYFMKEPFYIKFSQFYVYITNKQKEKEI